MREDSVLCLNPKGFHNIAYTVWGEEHKDSVPVICAHGLMGNGRAFDFLAAALAKTRKVYCPDYAGRGKSDWFKDSSLYDHKQYLSDMSALIARIDAKQVDWVGTSMGGLTGMLLASLSGNPIRRLVLNDVGPIVEINSVEKIRLKFEKKEKFSTLQEAIQSLKQRRRGAGTLTDDLWGHMAQHETRHAPDGGLEFSYDHAILEPLKALESDMDLWPIYEAIKCPTFVLRGGESRLLPEALAIEMTKRGPKATLRTFPNVGHAPSLMVQDQIEIVAEFLN